MNKALNIALGTIVAVGISSSASAIENWLDQVAIKGAVTYTEPTNSGLNFGHAEIAPNYRRPYFVEPNHEFDFSAGIEVRTKPNSDTHIFLDYDHYNDDKQRQASGLNALGKSGEPFSLASGDVKHDEHSLKVGAKHTLHFGPTFDFVLGAFFEYASVERTFKERWALNGVPSENRSRNTEDDMQGWGPGVSALGRAFPFGNENRNWSVFASGGFTLLYADHEYDTQYKGSQGLRVPSASPEDTKSIVTKLETSLGIEYTRLLISDMANLTLGARLGVKYINYINAFRSGNWYYDGFHEHAQQGGPTNLRSGPLGDTSHRDYGRMGPFLEFKLGGAHS